MATALEKCALRFSLIFSVWFLFHCFPLFSLLIIELTVHMLALFHHLLFMLIIVFWRDLQKCLICFEDAFLLQFTLKWKTNSHRIRFCLGFCGERVVGFFGGVSFSDSFIHKQYTRTVVFEQGFSPWVWAVTYSCA